MNKVRSGRYLTQVEIEGHWVCHQCQPVEETNRNVIYCIFVLMKLDKFTRKVWIVLYVIGIATMISGVAFENKTGIVLVIFGLIITALGGLAQRIYLIKKTIDAQE
jgi:hypothetical protein